MAGSYSRDLRGRVLAAVEAGEGVEAAAERFVVGRSTACRWVTAAREELVSWLHPTWSTSRA